MSIKYCPQCTRELAKRSIDGEMRLACPEDSCGWVYWNNPTPVVAGLVQRGDEVILIQNQGWPSDWWGLVSGFLEAGEDPAQGMLREVREELGVKAQLVSLIGVYGFGQRNQVIMAYHLRIKGQVSPGAELAGVKVVPIAELRPWDLGTGPAVTDWLAQRETA